MAVISMLPEKSFSKSSARMATSSGIGWTSLLPNMNNSRLLARAAAILLLVLLVCLVNTCTAQTTPTPADQQAQAGSSQFSEDPLRVCHRPLPKFGGSGNWFLRVLNRMFVHHIHHSYIDLGRDMLIPGTAVSIRTVGIHPVNRANNDKEPMPDQVTDNLLSGGECKIVKDATQEKMNKLMDQIAAGTCYSCGKNYHNKVLTGCYNNSNTYVYDLISGAGMTPPSMSGTPGYRHHHTCHF